MIRSTATMVIEETTLYVNLENYGVSLGMADTENGHYVSVWLEKAHVKELAHLLAGMADDL